MPSDKGGCRPLMAASSQLGQRGGEPSVKKCKRVVFCSNISQPTNGGGLVHVPFQKYQQLWVEF